MRLGSSVLLYMAESRKGSVTAEANQISFGEGASISGAVASKFTLFAICSLLEDLGRHIHAVGRVYDLYVVLIQLPRIDPFVTKIQWRLWQ
jgi:hypothetical protein